MKVVLLIGGGGTYVQASVADVNVQYFIYKYLFERKMKSRTRRVYFMRKKETQNYLCGSSSIKEKPQPFVRRKISHLRNHTNMKFPNLVYLESNIYNLPQSGQKSNHLNLHFFTCHQ
jgi:hypothetical protein